MRVIEHLAGRSPADDYVLQLLERWGLLDLRALWASLRADTDQARSAEVRVELMPGEAEELMRATGPRGGRLPR